MVNMVGRCAKLLDVSAHCDMLRTSTHNRACLALWSSCLNRARIAAWLKFCCTLCSRWVLHVSMTCFLVAAFCRSGWACWSSSQLVDCDTVDSACYFLAPGQCVCGCRSMPCAPRTGTVTPKTMLDFRVHIRPRSRKCHWLQGCLAVLAQVPVSVAIEDDGVFFQLFSRGVMQFWCGTNLDLDVLSVGCDTDGSTGCRIVQEHYSKVYKGITVVGTRSEIFKSHEELIYSTINISFQLEVTELLTCKTVSLRFWAEFTSSAMFGVV